MFSRWPIRLAVRGGLMIAALVLLGAGLIPWRPIIVPQIPVDRILHEQENAWTVYGPDLGIRGPSDFDGSSPLVLCEDGIPLQRTLQHADIRRHGRGLFCHWQTVLLFSSLDNTDPRSNGRRYSIHYPRTLGCIDYRFRIPPATMHWLRWSLGGILALLALSPAFWGGAQTWLRYRTMPTAGLVAVLAAVGFGLHFNAIDVTTAGGKLAHLALLGLLLLLFLMHTFLAARSWRVEEMRPVSIVARCYVFTTAAWINGAILLFACECLGRLIPVCDSFAHNPGCCYFWPEWYSARNSLGYPDCEPGLKAGPRVLLLGDSFTEGAGVRRDERFASRLQNIWRHDTPNLEVYAGARCGFDTIDEANLLEMTGDRVQPDLVVVGYVLNDAERDSVCPQSEPAVWEPFFLRDCPSYLYYRLQSTVRRASTAGYVDSVQEQHRPDGPGWGHVQRGLTRIARWCDERRVRKGLVVLPLFAANAFAYRGVMDRVAATAREHGFEAYNLLDDYGGNWEELGVSAYDSHLNAKAHAITARRLAELFSRPEEGYSPSLRSAAPDPE